MTSRKPISRAARFAVWNEWDSSCYWCRVPVRFADCEIDHLIPLDAVNSVGIQELTQLYSLSNDFDFDGFDNWVPTCPTCNQRKGKVLLDASPQLLLHLMVIRGKARSAKKVAENMQSDLRKDKILGRLEFSDRSGRRHEGRDRATYI